MSAPRSGAKRSPSGRGTDSLRGPRGDPPSQRRSLSNHAIVPARDPDCLLRPVRRGAGLPHARQSKAVSATARRRPSRDLRSGVGPHPRPRRGAIDRQDRFVRACEHGRRSGGRRARRREPRRDDPHRLGDRRGRPAGAARARAAAPRGLVREAACLRGARRRGPPRSPRLHRRRRDAPAGVSREIDRVPPRVEGVARERISAAGDRDVPRVAAPAAHPLRAARLPSARPQPAQPVARARRRLRSALRDQDRRLPHRRRPCGDPRVAPRRHQTAPRLPAGRPRHRHLRRHGPRELQDVRAGRRRAQGTLEERHRRDGLAAGRAAGERAPPVRPGAAGGAARDRRRDRLERLFGESGLGRRRRHHPLLSAESARVDPVPAEPRKRHRTPACGRRLPRHPVGRRLPEGARAQHELEGPFARPAELRRRASDARSTASSAVAPTAVRWPILRPGLGSDLP